MAVRPDVAIMLFDLNISGVARNAVRVANAAHAAGIRTEVWLGQSRGDLRDELDPAIVKRTLGAELASGYSRRDRKLASKGLAGALASLHAEHRPAVALSAGNHFHDLATAAQGIAGGGAPRLMGRISNAAPNASRTANPFKVFRKRRKAAARYAAMDHLVAVSSEIRAELIGTLKVPEAKISLIRNGIDLATVRQLGDSSPAWPWHLDVPIILGVGRLAPQKNFDLLIEAFARARRHRPIRLAILGGGAEEAREALLAQAGSLGVAEDIWIPGQIANPFPYYRGASLFVLPSRWEGMSNALLEAMASGCPAIAAKSAVGAAEILDDGRYGRLVSAKPEPLAAAILSSLDHRPPAETLIARAREFDLETTLRQYTALLEHQIELAAASEARIMRD